DPPAALGNLLIAAAAELVDEFVDPSACEDRVGMGVDESGDDRGAGRVDDRWSTLDEPLDFSGRADGDDRPVLRIDGRVREDSEIVEGGPSPEGAGSRRDLGRIADQEAGGKR